MRGPAHLATYLGRAMVVGGLVMIALAWNGAASLDYVQGQFPYLLSGAVPGLALILVGAGLEYVQTTRELTAQRARQMAELNADMARLVASVRDSGLADLSVPVQQAGPASPARDPGPVAGAGWSLTSDVVLAGRSSFHTPNCDLIAGRRDSTSLSRAAAEAQGLAACRLCKP